MKKVFIMILCIALALAGCSNNRIKVSDAQLLQLQECAGYTQKYKQEMMTDDIEILNSIITATDGFDVFYYEAFKDTEYKNIVDEIVDIYGCSKTEAIEEAKRYTYYIRLKALLLSDSSSYEEEFKKAYAVCNNSAYSKYVYTLYNECITMSEKQFVRVSDAYEELFSVYTDDIDQWMILTELKELYDSYEEYEYPQKLTDLGNQILDRHSVQGENGREIDDDFLKALNARQ